MEVREGLSGGVSWGGDGFGTFLPWGGRHTCGCVGTGPFWHPIPPPTLPWGTGEVLVGFSGGGRVHGVYIRGHALQRRGLAYDQSGLLSYDVHELWTNKLFFQRSVQPPAGYATVTFDQIKNADISMWHFITANCRSGIIPVAGSDKPMDVAMRLGLADWNVNFLLMPLPKSTTPTTPTITAVVAPGGGVVALTSKQKKLQKFKLKLEARKAASAPAAPPPKGKGKGKTKGPNLPAGLEGMNSKDSAGKNLCFGYNLGSCTSAGDCYKGRHGCMLCSGDHPQYECPTKKP